MDELPARFFLPSFFLALLFLSFSATSSEDEFSYDPHSENGPAHWGDIRPEWYKCKNGSTQSPINLSNLEVRFTSSLGPLHFNYHPSNASLFNTGHDIRLEWTGDAGHLLVNETKYFLQQCHWHFPSEHTINGMRFDLEIHMVHKSGAGLIAVVGIFYEIGFPDPFLQTVMDDLIHISEDREAKVPLGMVDPELVININKRLYYRYKGSLTTPPCDENVVWTVVGEVKQVSKEQAGLLRLAVEDVFYTNARPLQQLNGRLVQLQVSKFLYNNNLAHNFD
ncbi:alpha carbonic anhydrase 7-like [Prosopis cineraria]|uniref:alpha carbonic anhydrase 7-like n=1 Tax=Prosopis cineraria TaxID=364024 RepID=UPI0024105B28|nr:alpha carbonic anhydrase 7-like [Prosopis cineraria]